MLYKVMRHIRNFFPRCHHEGEFVIENGRLSLDMLDGQYYLIEGSVLNDGVYMHPYSGHKDESFIGCVTELAPPRDFLDTVERIKEFDSQQKNNGLTSESFGGYSYTRATNAKGQIAGWKDVFASDLSAWRKI